MTHPLTFAIIVLSLAFILTGCKQQQQRPLGQAYHQQYHAQIMNDRYTAPTPVTGLSGKLAHNTMVKYSDPKEQDKGPSFADVMKSLMETK